MSMYLNDFTADDLRRIYVMRPNGSRMRKYWADYELPKLNIFVIFLVPTILKGILKCWGSLFLKPSIGGQLLLVNPRSV